MPGLGLSEPAAALAAMQDINRAVRNPLFAVGFFGAAALALALATRSVVFRRHSDLLLGVAGLLYLIGVFAVTAIGNVPLNEALALVDPTSAAAAPAMEEYLAAWTSLNHVRTASALAATAILLWSLAQAGPEEA